LNHTIDLVKVWCPAVKRWDSFSENLRNCDCEGGEFETILSVITAVKDRAIEFENCIKSLSKQDFLNTNANSVEHIVQDAGGDPNRMSKIEKYAKVHTVLSLQKDQGLYSAFNIGLSMSQGSYIAFLNSDDFYERGFITKSLNVLTLSNADWSFGNIIIQFETGQSAYIPGKSNYDFKSWLNFSRFHHNTVVAKRKMFEVLGNFPTRLNHREIKFCADYFWFLSAQRAGFVGVYVPSLIGYMNWGGVSSGKKLPIYREAAYVALRVFPEKRTEIIVCWFLRYLDNQHLNHRLLQRFRGMLRKIYSHFLKIPISKTSQMGRIDERIK
jgi:glycosyltransferase involved in cell wall biosynthesis